MAQRSKSSGRKGEAGGAGKRRSSRPASAAVAPPDAQWKFHSGFWWWWAPGRRSWTQSAQGEAPSSGLGQAPGAKQPEEAPPPSQAQRLEAAEKKEARDRVSKIHRAAEAAKQAWGPLDSRTLDLVDECDDAYDEMRAHIGKQARVSALEKESETIAVKVSEAVVVEAKAAKAHQFATDNRNALEVRQEAFARKLRQAQEADTSDEEGCEEPPPFEPPVSGSSPSGSAPSSAETQRVGALEAQVGTLTSQLATLVAALQGSAVAAAGGLVAANPALVPQAAPPAPAAVQPVHLPQQLPAAPAPGHGPVVASIAGSGPVTPPLAMGTASAGAGLPLPAAASSSAAAVAAAVTKPLRSALRGSSASAKHRVKKDADKKKPEEKVKSGVKVVPAKTLADVEFEAEITGESDGACSSAALSAPPTPR